MMSKQTLPCPEKTFQLVNLTSKWRFCMKVIWSLGEHLKIGKCLCYLCQKSSKLSSLAPEALTKALLYYFGSGVHKWHLWTCVSFNSRLVIQLLGQPFLFSSTYGYRCTMWGRGGADVVREVILWGSSRGFALWKKQFIFPDSETFRLVNHRMGTSSGILGRFWGTYSHRN